MGATGARYDASSLSVDPTLLVTTFVTRLAGKALRQEIDKPQDAPAAENHS